MRLDGYWLINELINSKDYMKSFYSFVGKKEKIRPIELILSVINILLILLILTGGTMAILKLL